MVPSNEAATAAQAERIKNLEMLLENYRRDLGRAMQKFNEAKVDYDRCKNLVDEANEELDKLKQGQFLLGNGDI